MSADTTGTADILGLFPPGSSVNLDGELVVGGCRLADLAAATPNIQAVSLDVTDADSVRRAWAKIEASKGKALLAVIASCHAKFRAG